MDKPVIITSRSHINIWEESYNLLWWWFWSFSTNITRGT